MINGPGSRLAPVSARLETRREELFHKRQNLDAMARRRMLAARRRRAARIRRNRMLLALMVVGATIGIIVSSTGSGANRDSPVRASDPRVTLTSSVGATTVIPGRLSPFAWPSTGEGAVAVLGEGPVATSPREASVPIASLTKMMTAYLILHDHPLSVGERGPVFRMGASDVAMWVHASQTDESNVVVRLGEHLTEYQLFEALLIPSADNIANFLAIWDAKTIPEFVKKMNAEAKALGLTGTHYADASGVDPASRSTARDQALLGSLLMANPVVRSIVSKSEVAFPVAGTIDNYNPALGVDGIIGVKSGYTSEASGCLVTARFEVKDGKSVLVVAATTGQPDGLYAAAQVDEGLLTHAGAALLAYHPLAADAVVGSATVTGSSPLSVRLSGAAPVVVGWPGLAIHLVLVADPKAVLNESATSTDQSAQPIGSLEMKTPYGLLATAPLVTVTSGASPLGSSTLAS